MIRLLVACAGGFGLVGFACDQAPSPADVVAAPVAPASAPVAVAAAPVAVAAAPVAPASAPVAVAAAVPNWTVNGSDPASGRMVLRCENAFPPEDHSAGRRASAPGGETGSGTGDVAGVAAGHPVAAHALRVRLGDMTIVPGTTCEGDGYVGFATLVKGPDEVRRSSTRAATSGAMTAMASTYKDWVEHCTRKVLRSRRHVVEAVARARRR